MRTKGNSVASDIRLYELRWNRRRQYRLFAQAQTAGDSRLAKKICTNIESSIATDAWAWRVLDIDDADADRVTIDPGLSEELQDDLMDLLLLDPAIDSNE